MKVLLKYVLQHCVRNLQIYKHHSAFLKGLQFIVKKVAFTFLIFKPGFEADFNKH